MHPRASTSLSSRYKFSWLKSKYPDVEVHQEALSDQPGEAEFYYQTDHSGFSGLRSHTTAGWKTETFKVQRARLDDVLGDRKVGFIKIDVEGAEPLVFLGAEKTLRQSRPHILFECTLSGLQLFDWTPTAMYDLLCRKHGYSIYIVSDWLGNRPPLTVESFIAAMSHPAQAFNFFATQSV